MATLVTVASRTAMTIAGSVLLLVLGVIQVRDYEFFGVNVLPYAVDGERDEQGLPVFEWYRPAELGEKS